jgi:hypothetical protein
LLILGIGFTQSTAFTYQVRLNNNGTPANGIYDFQFELTNSPGSGTLSASLAVNVTNGLFTTTTIDFGPVFTGSPETMAIYVRTKGANSWPAFPLAPFQEITPTPYAIFANTAGNLIGTVATSQLPNNVVINTASGIGAAVCGGQQNTASGYLAAVGGGVSLQLRSL